MRPFLRSLLVLVLLLMQNYLSAQEKLDMKFGKISPADFDLSSRKFDTSAGAVFIADYGVTEFDGGTKGDLTLSFTRHARLKIINKNGFDGATFEIPLYHRGDREEKLQNLRANTYNLENGKVVVSKLEDKSVFKDKQTERWSVRKFTMPAVKEGSIVEVSYTIKSDFTDNLQPWDFQGAYPRLWSEYVVRIPDFLDYVFITQGFQPYYIKSQEQGFKSFTIIANSDARGQDTYTISANINGTRLVMKDVPPIKEEKFITTLDNYRSRIEFELSSIREPYVPHTYLGTWNKVSEDLLKFEYFGESLDKANNWLDDDIKAIVGGTFDKLEKAKKIYAYVRDNFTCTNQHAKYMENSLKNVFKAKKGSVAEINLLLIAMLKHEGIKAEPVLLSTRDNGYTHPFYPLMDRFNYVIAGLNIDGSEYYLDATERKIGFTHLPLQCYNGQARFISTTAPDPVYLVADSLKEAKITAVFVANSDKGKPTSSFKSTLGYYESLSLREKVTDKGKDQLLKDIKA
ncbi:MAG TPA: transglutaminase domain-containing protein, partial [Chitinophagaceae bacterium]|nr:transglutaminase domain-containing protein [Chitinophagaceae bacterium]